jgi:hypothetical protein
MRLEIDKISNLIFGSQATWKTGTVGLNRNGARCMEYLLQFELRGHVPGPLVPTGTEQPSALSMGTRQ